MSVAVATARLRTACALACVCLTLAPAGCGPARVEVPDVLGMTVPQATEALDAAGFGVGAVKDFREFETTPTVFGQVPPAGEVLERGASVDLVLTYDCYRCR